MSAPAIALAVGVVIVLLVYIPIIRRIVRAMKK
jgi:hypothetical protein